MSNLIVMPFVVLIILSLIFMVWSKAGGATDVGRQRLRTGLVLSGIAYSGFGLATIVGLKISARPEVTGTIKELRQYDGSRHKSSSFKVVTAEGQTGHLTCAYNGPSIREDETVLVRYLEFDHSILYLKVLDGPNEGWSLREGDNDWPEFVLIALAMVCFYGAYACSPKKSISK